MVKARNVHCFLRLDNSTLGRRNSVTVCLYRCVRNILRLYLIVRFLFTFLEIVVMSTKLVLMSRFTWNSPNDPGDFRECFLPSLDQTQQTVRSALELVLKVTSSHASSRIGICSCVRLCSCIARKKWHVAVVLVCAPNTANNTKTMLTKESNKILAQSKTTEARKEWTLWQAIYLVLHPQETPPCPAKQRTSPAVLGRF